MSDLDFEQQLIGRLREYAAGGLRPIDAVAVADATIARGGKPVGLRWPSAGERDWRVLLVVGLLLLALGGTVVAVGARLLAPAPSVPVARSYEGVLVPAGEFATPEGAPLAVGLQDGRVLLSSGGTQDVTTGEVFDPATDTFAPTGPLLSPSREYGAAAVLQDGRVLLLGSIGPSGSQRGIADLFDPRSLRFTAGRPMVTPRLGGTLARMVDGRVLVAGGESADSHTALAAAEIFDPASGSFTATGSTRPSWAAVAMAALPDGRVLVIGYGRAVGSSSAELYDPRSGTFSNAGESSMVEWDNRSAVPLRDGRVLAFGWGGTGGAAEVWDSATKSFSAVPGPPHGVWTATPLDDGRVLLTGDGPPGLSWAGIYDPTTGRTREIQAPPGAGVVAARLADGRVLLLGGYLSDHVIDGGTGPISPKMEIFQ